MDSFLRSHGNQNTKIQSYLGSLERREGMQLWLLSKSPGSTQRLDLPADLGVHQVQKEPIRVLDHKMGPTSISCQKHGKENLCVML